VNGLWGLGFALFWSSMTRPQLPTRFCSKVAPRPVRSSYLRRIDPPQCL
jgi:hypothetical protein